MIQQLRQELCHSRTTAAHIYGDSLHACRQQTNIKTKLSRVVVNCGKPLKTVSAFSE